MAAGGNAVDAAIAANAVLAVTGPHMCGMGGDLFALVHVGGEVSCLNASGRSGSGADAAAMRADGLTEMPMRHDIRSVTVPGCVDGWIELHGRFGSTLLDELFAPAIALAEQGCAPSPLLRAAITGLDAQGRDAFAALIDQLDDRDAAGADPVVRRDGVGRALRAVAAEGRDGFYGGEFGSGLLAMGDGWFSADDLRTSQATWVAPLAVDAFGVRLFTTPPNSQGYLTVAAAVLADDVGVPPDPGTAEWAHVLIECAAAAGHDRPGRLHDLADGDQLVGVIGGRSALIDRSRHGTWAAPGAAGDTTYLCTADADGMAVSLIQSNAAGFGSWLVEPATGINLHNRGLGFSLTPGHPAELRPGARPPHTLSPALATGPDGMVAVLGTMGGDAQPQIVLQLAARLFHHRQTPYEAVTAPRWVLHGETSGFDTWTGAHGPGVLIEGDAPIDWAPGLVDRGHRVTIRPAGEGGFGHAHAIVGRSGAWAVAADPRTVIGSAGTLP